MAEDAAPLITQMILDFKVTHFEKTFDEVMSGRPRSKSETGEPYLVYALRAAGNAGIQEELIEAYVDAINLYYTRVRGSRLIWRVRPRIIEERWYPETIVINQYDAERLKWNHTIKSKRGRLCHGYKIYSRLLITDKADDPAILEADRLEAEQAA